jgi:D-alanine-D-alanine ligase
VSPSWQEADLGVLKEVEAVAAALAALNIPCRRAGVRYLRDVPEAIAVGTEPIVFNLVESLDGNAADACFVPAVCWSMRRRCTGNDTACQTLCLDKWHNKAALHAHGVPVPRGVVIPPGVEIVGEDYPPGALIVKPLRADASEGIDVLSVVEAGDSTRLQAAVRRIHQQFGQAALVEQFVRGREVNASVLERQDGAEVLPLAEIDFSAFPPEKPRIVDYAAKWIEGSFEFHQTPRLIPAPVPEETARLVRRLTLTAWRAVGCRGYARVDFRMDESGRPFVLEVNPNPDIAPEAGFAAALNAAGIPYDQFVLTMLEKASAGPAQSRPERKTAAAAPASRRSPTLRWSVPADRDKIIEFTIATGYFRPDEIEVAKEVLDESLRKGKTGPYQSYSAEVDGRLAGWLCFGPTACALGTYDIYWIVVAPEFQRQGIGAALLDHAERLIREHGGRMIVVDTSTRPVYTATRLFYERHGYREETRVKDFYAPGDDKVISVKHL